MGPNVDILHTERLRLRWFEPGDAAFALELVNEPAWKANIGDAGVADLTQAAHWIETKIVPRYLSQGHGFWAVERKSDGELLGLCGIIHREGLPKPDLGYALLHRHWGQGYAREAAAACLTYAREVLGLHHLLATTQPHNDPSGRLLLDLGFSDLGLQQTKAYPDASRLYEWRTQGAVDDKLEIDQLVARFFGAFDNRAGRIPTLPALPCWLMPRASIHRIAQGDEVEELDVRSFVEPRARLLASGELRDFHEWETEHHTQITSALAHRVCRYRKLGVLRGEVFEGAGSKRFLFVRHHDRFRIAALTWQDD